VDAKLQENRAFPRVPAHCPVLYRTETGKQWYVAKLVDFSATGLRMECDENLAAGSRLALQIKPGSDKIIPAISAHGEVVRCGVNKNAVYEISCKLIKVLPT
jgi:hypothetical protein